MALTPTLAAAQAAPATAQPSDQQPAAALASARDGYPVSYGQPPRTFGVTGRVMF